MNVPGLLRLGAVGRLSDAMIMIWSLGFLVVAVPTVISVIGNERRRRSSRLVGDHHWLGLVDRLRGRLAIRHSVELRMCAGPHVPTTWGFWRPVILLPDQAREWSDVRRRLVLIHELAHIKRCDLAFQMIGRMATACYWFHPLAWYALHRSRIECECACDDHVVHAGGRRTEYARELVDLARSPVATIDDGTPHDRTEYLERRITARFEERQSHQPLSQRSGRALLAGIFVVLLGVTVVHPEPSSAGQRQDSKSPATPPTTNTAAAPKSPARPDPALPKTYTHPISLTGRATDVNGQPVAGGASLFILAASRLQTDWRDDHECRRAL